MDNDYVELLDLKDYVSIPEAMIKIMANGYAQENEQYVTDERNPYYQLLQESRLYSMVGLTPVFLCKEMKDFIVTSVERVRNEYQ